MDDFEFISNPTKVYSALVLTASVAAVFGGAAFAGYRKDRQEYTSRREELDILNEELQLHSEICRQLNSPDYAAGIAEHLKKVHNTLQGYYAKIEQLPLKFLLEPVLKRCSSSLQALELRVGLVTGDY